MPVDLRTKLQMIKEASKPILSNTNLPNDKKGPDISDLMEGQVISDDFGSFFLAEDKYPLTYLHGGYPLGKLSNCDISPVLSACNINSNLHLNDLLFLDTETTGLSGGTGTVAFLVGIGFFTDDAFVLRQYLMRDYDEEYTMLNAINSLWSSYKGIVTFNGKAFDWNLIQTRFIANRVKPSIKSPHQVDLLYPSRTLWKLKLESCKLSNLEENILSEYRVDDIPGAMIPLVYFKYLEDRDAADLKKVLTHNKDDIISMVSLLTKINTILVSPLQNTQDDWEILGAGKIYEKLGQEQQAIRCYEKSSCSFKKELVEKSLSKLAWIYKKNGEYDNAEKCLKKLIKSTKVKNVPAMIELAKIYEHRIKDISKALAVTKYAMDLCCEVGFLKVRFYEELKVRHERLLRKKGVNLNL